MVIFGASITCMLGVRSAIRAAGRTFWGADVAAAKFMGSLAPMIAADECVCKTLCTCLKPEAFETVTAACKAQIVVVPSQILALEEVLAAERLGEHSQASFVCLQL